MDDVLITCMVVINGIVSLTILYFVAPIYAMKGKLCILINTIKSHDQRIQSLEERSNGRQ